MTEKSKEKLLELLKKTHLDLQSVIKDIDMNLVVHMDSGWCVRDILAHITVWDLQTARSIDAFNKGSEYKIADLDQDEVDYNERTVMESRILSLRQVLEDWEHAYNEMCRTIHEIPLQIISQDILFPWGSERGSISTLVGYMLEHVEEHQSEIEKALKRI